MRAFERWERTKAPWLARAGYRVELLEGDPARRRSGSAVRAAMRAGDLAWREQVPAATVPVLERLLAARSLAAREERQG